MRSVIKMWSNTWRLIFFAACASICMSQPVQELIALKEQPAEVLYTTGGDPVQPFVLSCVTEGATSNKVKYSWHKNEQPFDFKSDPNIVQLHEEGSLAFLKPTQDLEGKFQCFAETDLGVASTRIISVKRAYLNVPQVNPIRHKPVEGRPFKLDCPTPDAFPKPKITWVSQLESDPNISSKIMEPGVIVGPDGVLYFSNVTEKHASNMFKYVCLAQNAAVAKPVTIAEHYIEGVVKGDVNAGEFVAQYLTQDLIAKAGDVTMIYCIYGSNPSAHPDWFFEGKDVNGNPHDRVTRYNRSSGKRLLIRDTKLEDQGTYKCTVDNGVGKPQEHSIHLTVVSAPKFEIKPEPIIAKENENVTVPCKVTGVNNPEISWTYNSKPIGTRERIHIDDQTDDIRKGSGGQRFSNLIITGVQKSDTGYYGCRAVNEQGDIYAESLLYVS